MRPVRTAARSMLAAIFVVQGLAAVRDPSRLAGRAKPITDRLAPKINAIHPALPTDAATLVRLNGGAMLAGGLLLGAGKATTPAALALIGTLVPTTLAGHAFWRIADPAERAAARIQFLMNMGLAGGLILAAVDTEGRPGIAWRTADLARRAKRTVRHQGRRLR